MGGDSTSADAIRHKATDKEEEEEEVLETSKWLTTYSISLKKKWLFSGQLELIL